MNISILKIFYLFALINSVSILKQILEGQAYYDLCIDMNIINGTESWPAKMRLRLSNYGCFCKSPSVNIDMGEKLEISALNLPSNLQLSPIMHEIGSCPAEEIAKYGISFETDKCNCVSSWPAILFALILSCYFFNVWRQICNFLIDALLDSFFCVIYNIQTMPYLALSAIALLLNHYVYGEILDIDVSFTVDGAEFSHSYNYKPTEWKSIFIQTYIGYFFMVADLVISIFKMIEEDDPEFVGQIKSMVISVINFALFICDRFIQWSRDTHVILLIG